VPRRSLHTLGPRRSFEKGTVPAVQRAIAILRAVASARDAVTLAELTSLVPIPKSSALGICATLVRGGLLQRSDGRYRLGAQVVTLANSYLIKSDATIEFAATWEALPVKPEETVVLSVLDESEVVYVACRGGTGPLTFNYRIGMRLPASCSASGKALLSTLPPHELERLFAGRPFPALTAQSVTSLAALLAELEATRRRGYALDIEEVRDGMCCVGVPVVDASGTAVAALGITTLKVDFTPQHQAVMVERVRAIAQALSDRLCGVTD
jgi:DNA-binding IclR family transcriptional regulator